MELSVLCRLGCCGREDAVGAVGEEAALGTPTVGEP